MNNYIIFLSNLKQVITVEVNQFKFQFYLFLVNLFFRYLHYANYKQLYHKNQMSYHETKGITKRISQAFIIFS